MRDEAELKYNVDSAKQAESIVGHPLFIASLRTLRELTVERFESLGHEQTKEMQECNMRLSLIHEFESNLMTIIQNGESAFKTLEEIQTFEKEMSRER